MENIISRGEINFKRFSIPYCSFGNGEKVIIAINGAQQSCVSWFPVAKYFSSKGGYNLVCFDFPGQGRAKVNYGQTETSVEDQLDIINTVADKFSPGKPFYMISASWGTVVAAIYAGSFPKRVTKKILLSFALKPNQLLMDTVFRGRQLALSGSILDLANLFIDVFGSKLSEPLQNSIRNQFLSLPNEHFKQLYKQSIFIENYKNLCLEKHLKNTTAKTLIVNGGSDPIVSYDNAVYAVSIMSDSKFISIPDAGHFLHFENPEIISLYYDYFNDRLMDNRFCLQSEEIINEQLAA